MFSQGVMKLTQIYVSLLNIEKGLFGKKLIPTLVRWIQRHLYKWTEHHKMAV